MNDEQIAAALSIPQDKCDALFDKMHRWAESQDPPPSDAIYAMRAALIWGMMKNSTP